MENEKEEIIAALQEICGGVPANARILLNLLVHPQVIELTKQFIKSKDVNARCKRFKAPWDCARESEAWFENVEHGWLGAGTAEQFNGWCEPCRRRMMGE